MDYLHEWDAGELSSGTLCRVFVIFVEHTDVSDLTNFQAAQLLKILADNYKKLVVSKEAAVVFSALHERISALPPGACRETAAEARAREARRAEIEGAVGYAEGIRSMEALRLRMVELYPDDPHWRRPSPAFERLKEKEKNGAYTARRSER